jgi:quercetin dioxygenase-like cupin family protein
MKYSRLYATADGESHFEHVEIDLELTDYVQAAPLLSLSNMSAATQFGFMEAPKGWTSDWHPSTARNLFVVLSGEWEVTASDGESRRFEVGNVLLVEDTSGKGHRSRVVSETDSIAVMVELGRTE